MTRRWTEDDAYDVLDALITGDFDTDYDTEAPYRAPQKKRRQLTRAAKGL
jgi:hypothetical protein